MPWFHITYTHSRPGNIEEDRSVIPVAAWVGRASARCRIQRGMPPSMSSDMP